MSRKSNKKLARKRSAGAQLGHVLRNSKEFQLAANPIVSSIAEQCAEPVVLTDTGRLNIDRDPSFTERVWNSIAKTANRIKEAVQ